MSATKKIRWSEIDWSKTDSELVRETGVCRQTVWKMRRKYGHVDDVVPQPVSARVVDSVSALDALRALAHQPAPRATLPKDAARIASSTKPKHILWASDAHFPEEDKLAWSCFVSRVEDARPDEIILGGDILEMESASRHGGVAQPKTLVDEIEYARTKLAELRAIAPSASILFLEGNHETRLSRAVVEALPTFDGALTLDALLGLDDLSIQWVRFGTVVRRGHVGFVHGKFANMHHAAKHLSAFGESLVYGHTHKPQAHHSASPHGVRGAYGMPCLRTLDPEWMVGAPTGWVHGWGEIYVDETSGHFNCYTVVVVDGRAIVDGKIYQGRGRV